ncbi:S-layer homology domain-containing protein [Falsibacillus pallidus]|uniref:S-layer family protein n=1 Tax=Falsibacillus pallidus TaxID=493781 RepID=A0A370GDD7_9BACI|nr:S-layer homology domain-containing protein [Falsibacillus pallidus]RDI39983.1 S-layer family protein [Falsibacillus pallidus]
MKKYPFSKKTMKAMLAATLVFSPVVASGVAYQPTVASAAEYSSVDSLTTALNTSYDKLSDSEKAELISARSQIEALKGSTDWDGYIDSILVNPDGANYAVKKQLVSDLLDVMLAVTTVQGLNDAIDQFSTNNSSTIDDALGQDITVQELLNYIGDVEINFVNTIKDSGKTVDQFTESDLFNAFTYALVHTTSGHEDLVVALTGTINFSNTTDVMSEIVNGLTNKHAALASFYKVVQSIVPATNPGGGGGGVIIPNPEPTTPPGQVDLPTGTTTTEKETGSNGQVSVVVSIPALKVSEIVNLITKDKAVIPIKVENAGPGEAVKAKLPATLFSEAAKKNSNAAVLVSGNGAQYVLPVSQVNTGNIASQLGVSADKVDVSVTINPVNPAYVKGAVDKNNLKVISNIVDFSIVATSGDKSTTIDRFSDYVSRTIDLSSDIVPNHTVGVVVNADGTVAPVPTVFTEVDGKKVAVLKRNTNSVYTIVENDKTFTDVNNGKNWAEDNIEKLASKYIINGKTTTTFAPNEYMTRGEFAALISRSLSLTPSNEAAVKFSDVSSTQAINKHGEIAAAVEAGIIKGKKDGKFHPSEKITRAEAAIMIDRAINFVHPADESVDSSKKVSSFKDYKKIGATSRESVEHVLQAGIMSGYSNGNFAPSDLTKRDQMAKILDTLLQHIKFIN